MRLTRRGFLGAAGTLAATGLASACGFVPEDNDPGPHTLLFTTWGTDSELAGFRHAIAGFRRAHPGASVRLNAVPYDQMFTNLDAQLQAGRPPDLFRVPYYTLGQYAGRGQLLDLRPHLPRGFADRFTPTAWAAVQASTGQGHSHPVGVPHHTDTSVILYNRDLLARAGVRSVPGPADRPWTWSQFEQVATRLRDRLPASKFPFAVNWQGNGVTRWLSWLFEANGRFLNADRDRPAIDSAAGRRALEFTSSFFEHKFVPPNTSVKSTSLAQDVWLSQTTAMVFAGAFALPDTKSTAHFPWGATYAPHDDRGASDFGGNAVVVTSGTHKPALAAAFLGYLTRRDPMRDFCVTASLLPTRRDLAAEGIRFTVRPELSAVFTGQARTVQPSDAAQVASPSMLKIITVLQDQLERAFVGGQGTSDTLRDLSSGIDSALTR